jgi:gluconate 2-dehydrogenase gamma chain
MSGTWRRAAALDAGLATGAGPAAPPAGALTPAELRDVDAIAALVIPTDDAPGAREARVIDFIDRGLATFASDQLPLFEQGLADLNARVAKAHPGVAAFADLPAPDQTALLTQLQSEHSEFFEAVRTATVTGFLSNPEYGGNAGKVGWKLIGFEDRYAWQPPFGYYDSDAAQGE